MLQSTMSSSRRDVQYRYGMCDMKECCVWFLKDFEIIDSAGKHFVASRTKRGTA